MNIYEQLQKEHSQENSLNIVSYIGNDVERFRELVDCFIMQTEDYRVPQRAGQVLSLIVDNQLKLILPYLAEFIQYLQKP